MEQRSLKLGGILALAIQLASEGFKVTTAEPVGEGFGGITLVMRIFTEIARKEELKINLITPPIEDCTFDCNFDFIFSINVMEHLRDPYSVLIQIAEILKEVGKYRFFCPNYDFPYEPHFGKWLWKKHNNSFYLQSSRANELKLSYAEQLGLHNSINYITLKKLMTQSKKIKLNFSVNKFAFYDLLNRALSDPELRERHRNLALIVSAINKTKLIGIGKFFPYKYQPVIDFTISQSTNEKS